MITFTTKGSFDRTERYLNRLKTDDLTYILHKYGSIGVAALANATPRDSGEIAESWYYTVVRRKGYYSLRWHNRHIEGGIPIVVLLQYGHGTRTGGWVEGHDYIMPAIRPILEQVSQEMWKEVTKV